MKILYIITSLATGGAEKLLLDTLPRYNDLGIKADILLLNGISNPFLEELKKQKCCKIFILDTTSPYQPFFIFKLIPFFKKYDLIHVHLFPANYFVSLAKMISRSKTPIVFTEHSTSNRRFRNKYLTFLNKRIYNIFNKIICITEEVRVVVEKKTQISSDKLVVINNGIDIKNYIKAEPYRRQLIDVSLGKDDFLLTQVSSFRAAKDQKTVIKALLLLPENVKLLLVGDGSLRKEHEILVCDLGMEKRVFFLGNRTDIPSVLKTCDISILSSNYEGFGLVAVEGMASGRPLIASDVPGMSGVVGGAGILFTQGNEKALAAEIMKLMNDQGHYAAIAEQCTERAKDFDISIMVAQHIKIYKELLGS